MPNRYVRESAIESERVNALSWQAEVFFRRLINRVDDFGRYTANFALLRASLFPLQLEKVTESDIKRHLAEVESCGLLATYESDGKRFLVLARWEQGRAKESRHPSPPAEVCERLQTYVYKPGQVFANAPDSDSDTDSDTDSDKRASASGNLLLPVGSAEQKEPEAIKALKSRIGSWFNRRESTVWSEKEIKSLKAVAKLNTTPEDIDALEKYYRSGAEYLRRDIFTLLNNWNTEIDRARGRQTTTNAQGSTFRPANQNEPRREKRISELTEEDYRQCY